MKITIIPADGAVGIDGVWRRVDLSNVDSTIHAVQFDTDAARGEIEYRRDATVGQEMADPTLEDPYRVRIVQVRRGNQTIDSSGFTPFAGCVDLWNAAAPQPPQPAPEPTAEEVEARRVFGIKRAAQIYILTRYPQWRQANLASRAVELVRVQMQGALTVDQETELAAIETVWAWIKAVRDTSNEAEASGVTADQIQWPA